MQNGYILHFFSWHYNIQFQVKNNSEIIKDEFVQDETSKRILSLRKKYKDVK